MQLEEGGTPWEHLQNMKSLHPQDYPNLTWPGPGPTVINSQAWKGLEIRWFHHMPEDILQRSCVGSHMPARSMDSLSSHLDCDHSLPELSNPLSVGEEHPVNPKRHSI